MNFIAHQRPKALINQLMSGERTFALKSTANDKGLKMRVVVAHNADVSLRHTRFNQAFYFRRIHYFSCPKYFEMARSVAKSKIHYKTLSIVYYCAPFTMQEIMEIPPPLSTP